MNGNNKIEAYHKALYFEEQGDYKEAFKLYLASAKQGYPKAQLVVAKYYWGYEQYANIIPRDDEKAVDFVRKAAEGGNAEAEYIYGMILIGENGNDNPKAIGLLLDALKRGYTLAASELAYCTCYGYGCRENYADTLHFIRIILYTGDDAVLKKCYDQICSLLAKINRIVKNNPHALDEDSLCLFKDLCSDLNLFEE